ncbi:MAG: bacteriocin family protein [Candidatus Rokubacteria bacterium]|nr:bacteriocin family protein [Candidatus Rokubacteria bacterium]
MNGTTATLRRDAAPLSARAWKEIDAAVAQAARHVLTARRIATFDGPHGWDQLVASRLGTMTPCQTREGKATVCRPEIILLAEVRAEFSLLWNAMELFERGAPRLDTKPAEDAAREVALAEDRLALYGEPMGGGFLTSPESPRVRAGDWGQPGRMLSDVLDAIEILDTRGIGGPYELVLSPARYFAYLQAEGDQGYPAARQLREVVGGVHRSPVVHEAGAVFSVRGGDFMLSVGGDLSVGYRLHDREAVHLFCAETIGAQAAAPEAVCILDP